MKSWLCADRGEECDFTDPVEVGEEMDGYTVVTTKVCVKCLCRVDMIAGVAEL